ncbi:MAG TPA: SAM-dependent methyltransferase, partial [Rhodocyclaceae bacterium]|nr:SAM-dependent methyltransferase [Rhodocyclaceae bacterium]
TPLFGQSLARQVAQVMAASAPNVLEVGAGSGALAADMLIALEAMGASPQCYEILELSGELRARQADTLHRCVPHLADRVRWLDALPEKFTGCIVANEVLDVMPVQLVTWRADGIFERGVGIDGAGGFTWVERPATGLLLQTAQALPIKITDGNANAYTSEICLAAHAWVSEWSHRLTHGAMLLIDYGYPQAEYYLSQRASGTVQCYYRHRAHPDLLSWPGLNDITAFVDFTAVAEAAHEAGLSVLGYITQANFLHNCGLLELLAQREPSDSADYLRAARAVHRLTGPHEMGELFKVLAIGRGALPEPLLGFMRGDRLFAL